MSSSGSRTALDHFARSSSDWGFQRTLRELAYQKSSPGWQLASARLLIHGNFLNESETEQVARANMAIVYCPRTHQHFGHPEYPLRRFLDSQINVVLGTDSRASNPDLDLWSEVLAVRDSHPWVSPEWLYGAVTQRAAEALGMEEQFGSLQEGRVAFVNVSRLDERVLRHELLDELTIRPHPFRPLSIELRRQKFSKAIG